MNLFSKVWPGQPEKLLSLVKARLGLLREGKRSSKCEVLFEFQGLFLSLHWTNHSSKPSRSGGGQGLEAGVRQDSEMGQVCDGRVLRKGEEGRQVPGRGTPRVPFISGY